MHTHTQSLGILFSLFLPAKRVAFSGKCIVFSDMRILFSDKRIVFSDRVRTRPPIRRSGRPWIRYEIHTSRATSSYRVIPHNSPLKVVYANVDVAASGSALCLCSIAY